MRIRERPTDGAARCPFCREVIGPRAPAPCGGCGVRLHAACAAELGRCPTIGCGALEPAPAPAEVADDSWSVARAERRLFVADPRLVVVATAAAIVGGAVAIRVDPESASLIVCAIAVCMGFFSFWFVTQLSIDLASSRPMATRVRVDGPRQKAPVRLAIDWTPAALERGLQRVAVRCVAEPGGAEPLYREVRVVRPAERRVVALPPAPGTLDAHPRATWTIDIHPVQGLGCSRFTIAPVA